MKSSTPPLFSILFLCIIAFACVPHPWVSAQSLTVNGRNAEYTTSKFFIDERDGDTVTLDVSFDLSGIANLTAVELFTNLDRRDFVDNDWGGDAGPTPDGVPDGIKPPDFNLITLSNYTNGPGSYYRPYAMADQGGGLFTQQLTADKCGAYRLTARFQTSDDPGKWQWYPAYYQNNGYAFPEAQQAARAHAVVISPQKALEMTLYELNTLTVEATDNTEAGRSTFDDLLGPPFDNDGNDPFNLDYLNILQVNCLWFQPIHPNGEDGRSLAEGYFPGSPYATKDYFSVSPWMGSDGPSNPNDAMLEFQNFVTECDNHAGSVGTINVMLDFVANHTSWDAVFGQGGNDLFGLDATRRIGWDRWYWYSDGGAYSFGGGAGEGYADYCGEADEYFDEWNNDLVNAPDRGDFGKWADTADLYFGRYAALVCRNPQDNGNYLDEGDWFDYASMTPGVIELWEYFGYYPVYWAVQTGHPGDNTNPAMDDRGVDAYRCDFGQGIPPQLWEYAINHTRKAKWNVVFMAETLDGGVPGYRSNRHFDILNEDIVFQFTIFNINNSWELRSALENRRNAYNSGAILLNITGHDETLPDSDAWLNASRYGALGAVDGLPMIFYGMEQGIQNYNQSHLSGDNCCWFYDGFKTDHELNFGKHIPHFKQWNQLMVWYPGTQPPNATGMAQWYGRVNWARHNSTALRSQNRWFLSRTAASGGGDLGNVFAVAKWDEPFVGPANTDIVLAFALLLPHGGPHGSATASYDLRGSGDALWNLLGLDVSKTYTVRNLASSDASFILNTVSGQSLYDNGLFVSLQGDNGQPITTDGALVQYLKVEEVPFSSSFSTMTLAGTFNSFDPTLNNMTLIGDFTWQTTISINETDPEFKFVADGDWSNADWGDDSQSDVTVPITDEAADLESSNNMLLSGSLSGEYTFTFDELAGEYSVAGFVNSSPSITFAGPYVAPLGQSWSRQVGSSDPDGDAVSLSNPIAPPGASFTDHGDGTGTFNWIPGIGDVGTMYAVDLVADDGRGLSSSLVTNNYTLLVPADSEPDGLPDDWEFGFFGSNYPLIWGFENQDTDLMDNHSEYIAGTDPTDGASRFFCSQTSRGPGITDITITTEPDRKYTIEYTDQTTGTRTWSPFADASDGVGTHVETGPMSGSFTFSDQEDASTSGGQSPSGVRAYRVKVEKAP